MWGQPNWRVVIFVGVMSLATLLCLALYGLWNIRLRK
jgi:hypothetical protein